jgi:hypothetical protein
MNNKKAKKEVLNGFVIMKRYRDNKTYRGNFKNNKRNGWGLMTYEFYNGRYDTYNEYYRFPDYSNTTIYPYPWVIYSGNWRSGEPNGEGKLIFPDDSYCIGNWKNGYITEGEFKYNDGRIYKGDFSKMHYTNLFHITPFKHGYGTLFERDGIKKYEGWWKSDPCEFTIASIFNDKYNYNHNDKIREFGVPVI